MCAYVLQWKHPGEKFRKNGSKSKPRNRPRSINLLAPEGCRLLTCRKFKAHLSGFPKFTCSVMAPVLDSTNMCNSRLKPNLTYIIGPEFQAKSFPCTKLNSVPYSNVSDLPKQLWGGMAPRIDVIHRCNCFVIRYSS